MPCRLLHYSGWLLALLSLGVPAQGAARFLGPGQSKRAYHQDNVTDGKPDLGALEHGQSADDWAKMLGHVGPVWVTRENAAEKTPHQPAWPTELDRRWGGWTQAK